MKINDLKRIAMAVSVGAIEDVPGIIDDLLDGETGAHWNRDLRKLQLMVLDGKPRFTVYARGNGKLPFLAFSALPGVGFCPGAGDCLNWCYSFRAWRYPAAFSRQVQNAILLQTERGQAVLRSELDKASKFQEQAFRLYVDGDFGSVANVEFWMDTLRTRPELLTYGYSKSWTEILAADAQGIDWPENYMLNLSSGSLHNAAQRELVAALPITRGEFIAVSMGYNVKSSAHGDREHQKALRAKFAETDSRKAFTCPGKCGECTPKGHACGSDRFRGIPVIIAVH